MKLIAKILGGLITLIILAGLAAPFFISADYLKAQLITQVKQATGREFSIKGKTSLKIFPTIAVSAEDVTLGNPVGFSDAYFAHIGKFETGAALAPLLHRRLDITGITIADATIHLEQAASGAKNWEFPATKKANPSSDAEAKKSSKPAFTLGDIHITNSALTFRQPGTKMLEVNSITFTLAGADGTKPLALDLVNASLYSGKASGKFGLKGQGANAQFSADMALSGIQIEPLMTALSGGSKLQGAADLDLDVTARGAKQDAILDSLSGTGKLKVTDGAVKGINIAQVLREAKKGFLVQDSETRKTDFSELSASFDIAQGIVNNKDLTMKSPALRVAGAGAASLPARSIDYRIVPTIVATGKGQGGADDLVGLDVPIFITGAWANPQIKPDIAGMLQQNLQNPEAFKQNLKDISGTIKQFNSPKDIGRALLGGKEAAPATTPTPATAAPTTTPQPELTPEQLKKQQKKQEREQLIQQGIGGLLQGLQK